jgi:leader peptidase (prepilin peptidase)/N-methyltransferase
VSLSLLGEALCGLTGAFVGVAIMGTADHYSQDATLIPLPTCPHCGSSRPVYGFVPVLGALLTYRCRDCRTPGSWWLACLVQIAMAALWATLASRYDFGLPLGSALVLTIFLGAIAVIDFQHRLIPSLLVYPTVVIAVAGSPFWPGLGLLSSIEGAAVGFALFFVLALFARFAFGEGALGDGDVTLAAAIGAICGYPLVILALALGAFMGGVGAILVVLVRRSAMGTVIPYGPFLIGGVIYILVTGNTLHPIYTVL